MDDANGTSPPRGLGWRMGAILGLVAFVAGLGAMALGLRTIDRWNGTKSVATVTLPVGVGGQQTPVVIVPAKTAAPLPAIDLSALSSREAELSGKIADLEARAAGIDTSARAASSYATRAEALMIAFAARRAIDRGLGLGYLEDSLRLRFGISQPHAVATIVQAAREPVTIEDLRGGLDGIAGVLVTGGADGGWLASVARAFGTLVVLHRAGTPSPLPADRVARARRLLDAGQVEAALAEVARTPGATHATGWTSAARRYVGVRQALDTIEATAITGPAGAPAAALSTPPTGPGMGAMPSNS